MHKWVNLPSQWAAERSAYLLGEQQNDQLTFSVGEQQNDQLTFSVGEQQNDQLTFSVGSRTINFILHGVLRSVTAWYIGVNDDVYNLILSLPCLATASSENKNNIQLCEFIIIGLMGPEIQQTAINRP